MSQPSGEPTTPVSDPGSDDISDQDIMDFLAGEGTEDDKGTGTGNGTGEGDKPNSSTDFPANTAVKDMTAEQQAAYWRHTAKRAVALSKAAKPAEIEKPKPTETKPKPADDKASPESEWVTKMQRKEQVATLTRAAESYTAKGAAALVAMARAEAHTIPLDDDANGDLAFAKQMVKKLIDTNPFIKEGIEAEKRANAPALPGRGNRSAPASHKLDHEPTIDEALADYFG